MSSSSLLFTCNREAAWLTNGCQTLEHLLEHLRANVRTRRLLSSCAFPTSGMRAGSASSVRTLPAPCKPADHAEAGGEEWEGGGFGNGAGNKLLDGIEPRECERPIACARIERVAR
jgi:hypothetical protein